MPGPSSATVTVTASGANSGEHAADDLLERIPVAVERHGAGVQPRHVEDVVGERGHALAFVVDGARELAPRLGREPLGLLGETAGRTDDRRERRAQVVRDAGEKRIAEAL